MSRSDRFNAPTLAMAGAVMVALLIGCGEHPADAVALSLYMRNLSGETHSFRIFGDHPGDAPVVGSVEDAPVSTGCGLYAPDWELAVTDGDGPPGPRDNFIAHVTADDAGNRQSVVIALTVREDGSALIEFRVPDWWRGDIQRCP